LAIHDQASLIALVDFSPFPDPVKENSVDCPFIISTAREILDLWFSREAIVGQAPAIFDFCFSKTST
jgi:hypothetical protein